ncbi:hypothetical protein ABK040_011355 [Willaertia magna]
MLSTSSKFVSALVLVLSLITYVFAVGIQQQSANAITLTTSDLVIDVTTALGNPQFSFRYNSSSGVSDGKVFSVTLQQLLQLNQNQTAVNSIGLPVAWTLSTPINSATEARFNITSNTTTPTINLGVRIMQSGISFKLDTLISGMSNLWSNDSSYLSLCYKVQENNQNANIVITGTNSIRFGSNSLFSIATTASGTPYTPTVTPTPGGNTNGTTTNSTTTTGGNNNSTTTTGTSNNGGSSDTVKVSLRQDILPSVICIDYARFTDSISHSSTVGLVSTPNSNPGPVVNPGTSPINNGTKVNNSTVIIKTSEAASIQKVMSLLFVTMLLATLLLL